MEVKFLTTCLAMLPPEQRTELLGTLFISFCGNFAQEEDPEVRRELLERLRNEMPSPENASQSAQCQAFHAVLNIFEGLWRDLDVINK